MHGFVKMPPRFTPKVRPAQARGRPILPGRSDQPLQPPMAPLFPSRAPGDGWRSGPDLNLEARPGGVRRVGHPATSGQGKNPNGRDARDAFFRKVPCCTLGIDDLH